MAGSYTVIVTDASSCSNMATFTVSENVTNPAYPPQSQTPLAVCPMEILI
ncbi:MAG: hypothetical protein IPO26_20140 [Saprospiraceae bacterium]|nr:hypothetical protein [Saprospiraceae bacterium]